MVFIVNYKLTFFATSKKLVVTCSSISPHIRNHLTGFYTLKCSKCYRQSKVRDLDRSANIKRSELLDTFGLYDED